MCMRVSLPPLPWRAHGMRCGPSVWFPHGAGACTHVQAAELAGEAWDRAERAAHASEAVHEREGEGRAHALESDAGDLCMWAVGGGRWGGQQDGGCAPAQPAGHHLQQGAPASWLCCSHGHVLKVPRLIPFLLPLCG